MKDPVSGVSKMILAGQEFGLPAGDVGLEFMIKPSRNKARDTALSKSSEPFLFTIALGEGEQALGLNGLDFD